MSLKLAVDTPSRAEIQLEMGMVHQKLQDFRAAVAHLSAVRHMHAGAPCKLSLHMCSRANIQSSHWTQRLPPVACDASHFSWRSWVLHLKSSCRTSGRLWPTSLRCETNKQTNKQRHACWRPLYIELAYMQQSV